MKINLIIKIYYDYNNLKVHNQLQVKKGECCKTFLKMSVVSNVSS